MIVLPGIKLQTAIDIEKRFKRGKHNTDIIFWTTYQFFNEASSRLHY
jgi:hypothetical protein